MNANRRADPVVLSLRDIALGFGGLQVLNHVNLDVPPQGITAIIGPNGAGKTALLNCISGIYRPNSGQIMFGRRELNGLRPETIARLGIGRSFQNLELFPTLTVTENLLVARDSRFRGGPIRAILYFGPARSQEARQRAAVEEVIDFFELWPVRNLRAQDLPYGQQKIVGLARAIAMEPTVLLLDEPGSGLTRDEKEDLARFLLRLREDRKLPLIWIEHDLQMVMDLADQVYAMNLGECIAGGPPEVVRNDPAVISAYIGGETP